MGDRFLRILGWMAGRLVRRPGLWLGTAFVTVGFATSGYSTVGLWDLAKACTMALTPVAIPLATLVGVALLGGHLGSGRRRRRP